MRVVVWFAAITAAYAQMGPGAGQGQGTGAVVLPLSGRSGGAGSATAVQTPAPGATSSINTLNPQVQIQGPFAGSTPQAPMADALSLSLADAIRRALEFNLGPSAMQNALRQARGQATVARSALLPNISATLSETVQKTNLRALGVRIPFAPSVVGPFNYFDLRARLTQSLFDLTARKNVQASKENVQAAEHSVADARDVVVFAAVGAYLQAVTAASRVDAAQAQVKTAQTLLDQAVQQNKEGVVALVDVNRARVRLQTQQQRTIVLENDVAKQKLNLARIVGLAPGQTFTLSDSPAFAATLDITLEDALKRAATSREDLRAAEAQVRAAEAAMTAARAERLPSVAISADYGAIGTNPAQAVGTYTLVGSVRIPIWQGGRIAGVVEQASAALDQRRAELADTRGRIDQEIRSAFLDLDAAVNQMRVAEANRDVARQSLELTSQRYEAGVTDVGEVVQAQEVLAIAEQDILTSAFSHNVAKAALARAMGNAEISMLGILGLR
jgi:outer membrane protein TolC